MLSSPWPTTVADATTDCWRPTPAEASVSSDRAQIPHWLARGHRVDDGPGPSGCCTGTLLFENSVASGGSGEMGPQLFRDLVSTRRHGDALKNPNPLPWSEQS